MKKIILSTVAAIAIAASATAIAAPQDFNVSWNTVTGSIVKYQLKTRIDTGTPVTADITSGTSAVVNKDITTGQKLYAQVRACDSVWCGDWSTEVSFTMPAKPDTPSIIGIQLIITN